MSLNSSSCAPMASISSSQPPSSTLRKQVWNKHHFCENTTVMSCVFNDYYKYFSKSLYIHTLQTLRTLHTYITYITYITLHTLHTYIAYITYITYILYIYTLHTLRTLRTLHTLRTYIHYIHYCPLQEMHADLSGDIFCFSPPDLTIFLMLYFHLKRLLASDYWLCEKLKNVLLAPICISTFTSVLRLFSFAF